MGFYVERVVPRIVNAACGMKSADPLRARVCAGLAGQVVEIGFGSGLNVPFYPAAVTGVAAVEPADLGWHLARERLAISRMDARAEPTLAHPRPVSEPYSRPITGLK